jgi:tetratricopeptide (TPR) repeat protein
MSQKPLPLQNEIVEKLNELTVTGEVNDIALQAVKVKINKITDSATKHRMLGMFFAVKNDVASVIKHFKIAIKLYGNSPEVIIDYAIALNNVYRYDLSYEFLETLISIPSINNFKTAILSCTECWDFEKAISIYELFKKAHPEKNEADVKVESIMEFYNEANVQKSIAETLGFDDNYNKVIFSAIQMVNEFTTENVYHYTIRNNDVTSWCSFVWKVNENTKNVDDLSDQLDNLLIENYELIDINKLVFRLEKGDVSGD